MVGAGVIAAVANALDRRPFPFVFGGDGASFAVSASDAPAAADALAAMAAFAREEFHFDLRVATIPVERDPRGRTRRESRSIRVPRRIASMRCSQAAGSRWFEEQVKRGDYSPSGRQRRGAGPTSPVSPAVGESHRRNTASCCR